MKKSVSILLSALMLAAAFVACAPKADVLNPAITLASSDAQAKAEWLSERLDGSIPDEVIIGIGSNDTYGIDMTGFKDDGYIARAIGDEVLLFGATAEGLDGAVREYAKAAEKGASAELDTVFHEGEFIEKLTIDGNDISEYTVVYRDTGEEVFMPKSVGATTGNAEYAAGEFVRLIEIATGIELPVKSSEEKVSGNIVMIDYLTDGEHGETGFTYEVKDSNLYISGVGLANGCANGVYYFLEYECGWDGLICGDSYLSEVDALDIPNGTSADVDPMFDYVKWYGLFAHKFKNDHSTSYLGRIKEASHGITAFVDPQRDLVSCFSNESIYMNVFDKVYTKVVNAVDAGSVIGVDLTTIDIAMEDAMSYCTCKDCAVNLRDEGSQAGSFVLFANRLAEDMENEGLGGLVYAIFAYHGSNPAPKTHTRDDVYVTYCFDGNCGYHGLEDPNCWASTADHLGKPTGEDHVGNAEFAKWVKDWGEVCDNVYVWYYALGSSGLKNEYTMYDFLYDDITFLHECNIKGFFFEMENSGFGLARVRWQMVQVLQWNPDLTEEEFNACRDRILEREYGDGWQNVHEYITLWERTEHARCENIWGNDFLHNDMEMYRESADDMFALLDEAHDLANNSTQAANIERLFMTHIYNHCLMKYFDAYNAYDDEAIAALQEKYALFARFADNSEFSMASMPKGAKYNAEKAEEYFYDLEEEIWKKWADQRERLTFGEAEERPMPEKWAAETTLG